MNDGFKQGLEAKEAQENWKTEAEAEAQTF